MWKTFCRNILEQSCVIWHSQLTNENSENLERLQKTFTKLALKNKYKNYVQALDSLQLEKLSDRRRTLCLQYAKASIKYNKLQDLFPENIKYHDMETRYSDKYRIQA